MRMKKSLLRSAQEEAQAAIDKTNQKISEMGEHTGSLYATLNNIQKAFDVIRNVPSDKKLEYEKLKEIRLEWKQQADKIERDYKVAAVKNAGAGVAGVGAGVAVVALGPTAAMGIATTFGVASTGTAISTLSGVAATNAALAWLGGGALAVGGGGMAAGNAFLALAGPVGWCIACAALLTSGLMVYKSWREKKHVNDIITLISKRDVMSYELAIVELNERISRITDEGKKLESAITRIKSFGTDYANMTEDQQYELGTYVNLMRSTTQLLVEPIMGLLPKYSNDDFERYKSWSERKSADTILRDFKVVLIYFANLLYKIDLSDKDKKILYRTFKANKKLLESLNMEKKDFVPGIIDAVEEALLYKVSGMSSGA